MRFRARPPTVEAFQINSEVLKLHEGENPYDWLVINPDGTGTLINGYEETIVDLFDWIVTEADGNKFAMSDVDFHAAYELDRR